MRTIDFYERPDTSKRGGYYFGYEIDRPLWVWHMYRDMEEEGIRFHVEINEEETVATFSAKMPDGSTLKSSEVAINEDLGKRVDIFIQSCKMVFESLGTTVIEEQNNEDNISQGEQLPQLRDDQLDSPSVEPSSDRRTESGDGPSEHDREVLCKGYSDTNV